MAVRTKQETRRYDHLYDPTYTVSSSKNLQQAHQAAIFRDVERVPDAKNMFSEIRRFPRAGFRLPANRELPRHIAQQAFEPGGPPDAPSPVAKRSAGQDMSVTGSNRYKFFSQPSGGAETGGVVVMLDRESAPAARQPEPLSRAEARRAAATARAEAEAASDGHLVHADPRPTAVANADGSAMVAARSVGVQTKYRDSGAQTDPFTPAYTVKAGHNPEVLALAHVRVRGPPGAALPAGPAEVALVERLRQRRELEASLPPMTDEAGFAVRKRLMQEQELRDWQFREAEIDATNEAKVSAVADALEERERRREFVSESRVEKLRAELERTKQEAAALTTRKRMQALRKLARDREAAERKADAVAGTAATAITRAAAGAPSAAATGLLSPGRPGGAAAELALGASSGGAGGKASSSSSSSLSSSSAAAARRRAGPRGGRDIIADYADPSSTVFAPRRRDGAGPDRLAAARGFDVSAVAPVHGATALNALDDALPAEALTATIRRPEDVQLTAKNSNVPAAASSSSSSSAAAKAERAVAADLERVHELLQSARAGETGPKAAALLGLTGAVVTEAGPLASQGAAAVASAAVHSGLGRSKVDAGQVPAWRKAKVIAARPSTPTFEAEDETEEEAELEQAVLLLQRLLRGRAEQNQLSEGKDRRMALIGEIRRDLLRAGERRAVEEQEAAAEARRRLRLDEDAALDAMSGAVGSATADFLAKELVRAEQQRRVARVAASARAERARREAEEGGRRQAEENVRAKRDMVVRQLTRVHAAGAATLVADALDEAIEQAAHDTATTTTAATTAASGSGGGAVPSLLQAAAAAADTVVAEQAQQADDEAATAAAKGALQDAGISPRAE